MTSCPRLLSTVQFLHWSSKSRKPLSPSEPRPLVTTNMLSSLKKKNHFFFWLHWVFAAVRGLSPAAVSRGYFPGAVHGASHCGGFSCCRAWAPGHVGLVAVARRLFLNQGSNPCPLHWQLESQPLDHQESSMLSSFKRLSHSLKERLTCGWGKNSEARCHQTSGWHSVGTTLWIISVGHRMSWECSTLIK